MTDDDDENCVPIYLWRVGVGEQKPAEKMTSSRGGKRRRLRVSWDGFVGFWVLTKCEFIC